MEEIMSAYYLNKMEERMARTAKKYPPGTVFEKDYKGEHVKVVATKNGFRYGGKVYDSLQDAVSKITKGKKYPASVFFSSKATGAKRGRKPKVNGTEGVIVTETTVETTNLAGMIQSAIRDAVREKVEELFRS